MAHRITENGLNNAPIGLMHDDKGNMRPDWLYWLSELVDAIPFFRTKKTTLDPSSVPANSTTTETVTFNGVTTSDWVGVNKPSHTSGLTVSAFVSANDTVTIEFANITGSPIDPGSETYLLVTVRM